MKMIQFYPNQYQESSLGQNHTKELYSAHFSLDILSLWYRFGGKIVFLIGMITLSGTSLLIPFFARISPGLVVVVRVLQGLASGLSYPSLYNLCSSWTDPGERATLMSIAYAGIPTATVATFPLTSWLCYSGLDGGWPMAFYVPGTTGLVWCALFYVLIYSTPEDHPRITKGELEYLRGSEPVKKRKLRVTMQLF